MKRTDKIEYTEDFLAFWKTYPQQLSGNRRHRPGKRNAFRAWLKLSEDDRRWAAYSSPLYARMKKDGKFVLHASTWLNQCYFEDFNMPEPPSQCPKELTSSIKTVESRVVNISNERNKQKDKLSIGRKEYIK